MSGTTARQRWRDAIRDSDDPEIDGLTRAVAFALDRYMSADGRTYTGVRRLAQLAGINSQDVVKKRLGRLIEAGWVTREWAGRGHKAYYQVGRPTAHSEVGHDTAQSPEVSRLAIELSRTGAESEPSHGSDPDTTPTTPKGGGVGGAAKAAAGAAPPLKVGDGPAGEAHMEWITNVIAELGFDPDEVDLYDKKLVNASLPLQTRTAPQIRNALGRQPKGLRERLTSPSRFVAKKLTELHELPDTDPRWKPRPSKPKKTEPKNNGKQADDLADIEALSDLVMDVIDQLESAPGVHTGESWDSHLREIGFWDWDDNDGEIRRLPPRSQVDAVRRFVDKARAWLNGEEPPVPFISAGLDRRYQATNKDRWHGLCSFCLRTLPVSQVARMTHCGPAHNVEDLICGRCKGKSEELDCPHCAPTQCSICGNKISDGDWKVLVDGQPRHSVCPQLADTDNVTDITASDAYQRGVAKARAALTGQPVEDLL